MDCKTCGHAKFRIATDKWECQLPDEQWAKCFKERGSLWVEQVGIDGVITAELLAEEIAGFIYNQGKAKIFNLLESQLENGSRLSACKRIAQDIIGQIAKHVAGFIKEMLFDWQADITAYGEFADPENAELEYEKMKEVLR